MISEKTNVRRLARHYGIQTSYDDLWLEALRQNVPGTWQERSNWQRKARYSLEQIRELTALRETLLTIDRSPKRGSESEA